MNILFTIRSLLLVRALYGLPDQRYERRTVQPGENVSLACPRQKTNSQNSIFWMRQVSGDMPEVLASTYIFDSHLIYFDSSRVTAKQKPGMFVLHIPQATRRDSGLYYCAMGSRLNLTILNGTYLSVEEHEIIQDLEPKTFRQGDSVTLQCSVLSTTCPGEHSVFWFRAGSGEINPGIIYTDGNKNGECEENPETSSFKKNCSYSLRKNNISSSDTGTYVCAVATCGEILFGHGITLELNGQKDGTEIGAAILISLCVALAVSVVTIVFLVCLIKKKASVGPKGKEGLSEQAPFQITSDQPLSEQRNEDILHYSALNFSKCSRKRETKARQKEETYSEDVKETVSDVNRNRTSVS